MLSGIMARVPLLPFAGRMIGWHLRYALSRTPAPLACGLYITSACNLRCSFCNIRKIDPPFTVDAARARKLVTELGAMKTVYFSVSGGEPLLVPHLFDVLACAKSAGILYTHVVSNGLLMDADRAKALAQASVSEISFSLDGPEAVHDAARGRAGSYQRVLDAAGHVKTHAPKTRIVLNAILDPAAPEHALHAADTARQLGVTIKVQPRNEHPAFGARDGVPQCAQALTAEERRTLETAIAALLRAPHVVNSRPFLKNYLAFLFDRDRLMPPQGHCIFGHHHVECFGGKLFPCLEGMDWTGGFDWDDRPLPELFGSPEYGRKLHELRNCQGCQKRYYVCYYEPRLNFPVWNLARSRVRFP